MDKKPKSEKLTPENAMAGKCYVGPDPSERHDSCSSVEPFEVQKQYLSNKPLFRQKVKTKKGSERPK